MREERDKRDTIRTPMKVVGIVMTVFYLGLGLYILLQKDLTFAWPALRIPFAVLLIGYGVFRGFRLFVK